MKSIGNCLKLALLASLFSIAAISCSNDDFFGFEDVYLLDNSSNLSINDFDVFLDWNYDGLLINATHEERQLFLSAYERCQYTMRDGQLITSVKNGSEINISERLFQYISDRVRESNAIYYNFSSAKKLARIKRGDREQADIKYNKKNCPCFTLAYIKSLRNGVTYDAALRIATDNTLRQKFGQKYDDGDLVFSDIPTAAQECSINGGLNCNDDKLQTDVTINGAFAYFTGNDNGVKIGHMHVIHYVERSGLFGPLYLFYSDPSYEALNPIPIVINRKKFPIVTACGDTIFNVYQ